MSKGGNAFFGGSVTHPTQVEGVLDINGETDAGTTVGMGGIRRRGIGWLSQYWRVLQMRIALGPRVRWGSRLGGSRLGADGTKIDSAAGDLV